ncbi:MULTISPECIES: N-acyl homoserine lactonase family protein [Flagellimonas]|uniref:N-acyl homoserine lactonase family protein n=2 Tax=Flagellimonas TaxID=444459 RepID=A0A3A1NGZ1_9FLAO|nr:MULTISPECIES: N-acyl homoserine lactonase family protein [Allomuricauda]RIV44531.1 N-acyl homoserine lactonase family protein [Allomuricauda maritima]RIV72871.1 N-acyl homoserine lactonase family protein [Allomuricauda aequoris]TXJ94595.1 N-acyl homoserine lactonase family protein [Allomuricauda maritima]TXK05377.1 N-acyl homoserine lactonase family protein [Allomuricauda aequoris]
MKKLLALLLVLATFSCKQAKKETAEVEQTVAEEAKPEVKLYAFSGGTVNANKLELFSQDTTYTGQSKEFGDAFYVIVHPKGTLMWDAGLPESLVGMDAPYTSPDGAFTVSRKDSVVNQLATIGMKPSDIDYIALSHTHFDHVGHANEFAGSTWLVQEKEYDFATSEENQKNNADIYNAIKDLTKVKKIANTDYDVFGDGTVVMKFMPGHTPGHQVLFLDLAEFGPLLLSGDMYHFYENREYRRVPIFNYDVAQTKASMAAFEAFAEEKGATVYLQHSKEDFEKLPKAPNYLK